MPGLPSTRNVYRMLSVAIALVMILIHIATGRADEPGFAAKPTVTRGDGKTLIAFEVTEPTGVEVAIVDAEGTIVRHLVAGRLGDNPPAPLKAGSLNQRIEWDGKDDHGEPATGGPFRARVRLGMRPRFDDFLLYEPDAMTSADSAAVGPGGHLYVFYRDPTANRNQGGYKVRIVDREANFIRQILPFPADVPYGKIKATGAFRDGDGHLVPRVHNWHSLNFYPDTEPARGRTASAFQCPAVDADGRLFWIIDGGRLCAIDADGGIPYETFLSEPLLPKLEHVTGRPALAVSADRRSLYAAGFATGRYDNTTPVPVVLRIDTATRKAAVFLGDLQKHETFINPRGLAVANGLLYVADPKANRIAVYNERTRELVGEMTVTLPHVVQVHPSTGAVYVCSYVPEEHPRNDGKSRIKEANLLKFSAYTDAKPAYQIALPRTGLSPNGGAHRIMLDATTEPPLLWLPGLPYARDGADFLACCRDTGTAFERVPIERTDNPWGYGPRDMLVDRRRGDLYIKVTGEKWHQFDAESGTLVRTVRFPKNRGGPYSGAHGANLGIDADGNYITHCWGKGRGLMRWDRDTLEPLPWEGKRTHRTEWGGMMTFQLNYMAIRGDDIYLIKPNRGPMHLDVFDRGLNRQRRVVWNVRKGSVPRVDARGNIYVTAPLRPLDRDFPEFFDGKLGAVPDYFRTIGQGHYWYTYMYGSIVKFPPQGGAFRWEETKRTKNDFTGLPDEVQKKSTRTYNHFVSGRYPHKPAEVFGAEWVRFGYSPYSETYPAGTPVCMCEGSGFDVDPYGRVFYPNLCRFRVEVVDANNNFLTHFGKYGNQDSGPGGRTQSPSIPLAWPTYIAVGENCAYVNDTIGMRVVKVRLDYAAGATSPIE